MKAFVISYNRLTWLKNLCDNLADLGCEVIIVDNGSTYKPLIIWFENNCPYKVHFLDNSYGHKSPWQSGIIDQYNEDYYIVTDHDLDISQTPKNFLDVLMDGLLTHDVIKCGLGLKLSDLPKNNFTKQVIDYEQRFWETQKTGIYYYSDIDTTLAMYSAEGLKTIPNFYCALRVEEPYVARHLPWYNEQGKISEEEQYYIDNIRKSAYWSEKFRDTKWT